MQCDVLVVPAPEIACGCTLPTPLRPVPPSVRSSTNLRQTSDRIRCGRRQRWRNGNRRKPAMTAPVQCNRHRHRRSFLQFFSRHPTTLARLVLAIPPAFSRSIFTRRYSVLAFRPSAHLRAAVFAFGRPDHFDESLENDLLDIIEKLFVILYYNSLTIGPISRTDVWFSCRACEMHDKTLKLTNSFFNFAFLNFKMFTNLKNTSTVSNITIKLKLCLF